MIAWNNEQCLTSKGKSHEKNWGGTMGPEIRVFAIFSSLHASLVFLDIALDCSFGQCLTSSRAETPPPKKKKKKKIVAQIRA